MYGSSPIGSIHGVMLSCGLMPRVDMWLVMSCDNYVMSHMWCYAICDVTHTMFSDLWCHKCDAPIILQPLLLTFITFVNSGVLSTFIQNNITSKSKQYSATSKTIPSVNRWVYDIINSKWFQQERKR